MNMMNIDEIMKILPHRYPFLLVDKVLEIDEDEIKAIKNVSINEPYFVGHFPEYPIMPGVLQIEGLAQTAGILMLKDKQEGDSVPLFLGIDKARFKKEVRPGETITYNVKLLNENSGVYRFEGKVTNKEGKVCCKATILAALKTDE